MDLRSPKMPMAAAAGLLLALPIEAQSALGRSPNIRAAWTGAPGAVFVLAHRFEFLAGGDEMLNVPTLTLGSTIGRRFAAGVDFSSNSELVTARLGQNEAQYWMMASLAERRAARLAGTLAFNSAARSIDGALTAALRHRFLTLLAEARAFSDALGSGEGGHAGAVGAVVHLTPYLELSGDLGRLLSPDTLGDAWSAGIGIAIPGTPHTFSINASNGGAHTLQSASRPKVLGPETVRYGFVFTAPLGSQSQWLRVFRRGQPHRQARGDTAAAQVVLRQVAFAPREVRIRVGGTVAWRNADPMVHTVTADDGTWGSGLLREGDGYRRTFDTAGRFPYHCEPHPQMQGVVIVEP